MSAFLTHDDVQRLMADPSPHVRAEVAAKLAHEIDSEHLTEAQLALAHDIIALMAKDVEVTVRKALSHSLRSAARMPHAVALKLANDIEAVALPILTYSPVLTDHDLIDLVCNGSSFMQETIAGRPNVSERVAEVLIADAGEKAVAALMDNITARISEASLNKAVDRFASSDMVKESIVKRATLPITVTERLVAIVSEQLKEYLMSHHELSPAIASDLVLQSRERSIIRLNSNSSAADAEKLAAQMYANKRLTTSIVLRALCMGDIAFFEAAVAIMANVPLVNARILLHDAGRLGLKSLYTKSGLPPRLLPAVQIAIEVVDETMMDGDTHDRQRYRTRVIQRILTQYEDFGPEDLDYLLGKLGDVLTAAA